ncbi:MAG: response regulator [Polyangiaceae bacterium]
MSGERRRILVVDDKAQTRAAVVRILRAKYDVIEADDGQGALTRVKAGEDFDLILLDVEMPIVNGREAFQRISIIAPHLSERVLFLTGGARDPEIQEWLMSLDPERVLWKPIASADLHKALDKLEARNARSKKRTSSGKMRSMGKIPAAKAASLGKIKVPSSGKIPASEKGSEPSKRRS